MPPRPAPAHTGAMTDFRFPAPDGTLVAVRACVICVEANQLLLCRDRRTPGFLALPGGAVRTGEASLDAARREWREETGAEADLRPVGVVENFFEMSGHTWHAVEFYFRVEGHAGLPPVPFTALDNPDVTCLWLPLSELGAHTVYPRCLPELLRMPDGQVGHFVTDDRGEK